MSNISAKFPFESKFIDIDGAKVHYVDEGAGTPILFLHGVPTSNYLWRNIIPHLTKHARCIAPDLIGMGKSDKPDIQYTVFDHIRYIEKFINELKLDKVILVVHGLGSMIGFDIAMRHPKKLKGIVFYEAYVRAPIDWNMLSLPVQQLATLLKDSESSRRAIIKDNYFLKKVLPRGVLRKLSAEESAYYTQPFADENSRKPLWQFVQDLPLNRQEGEVINLIANYSKQLQRSDVPKLMLYSIPGFITTIDTIAWCDQNLSKLTLKDLGDGLHFAQETDPIGFTDAIEEWLATTPELR